MMKFNLNGLLCNNVSITAHRQDVGFMYMPGRRPGDYMPMRKLYNDDLDVSLRIETVCTDWQMDWLLSLQHCRGNLVALGSGLVCDYCAQYNPPGMAYCVGCGAMLHEHKFAKAHNFPFVLSYIDTGDQLALRPSDEPVMLHLVAEFVCTMDKEAMADADSLFGSDGMSVISLPYDLHLRPGLYVCEYCGSVNESGKQCGSCGAGQLPWTEVVKLEHKCLYCGRELMGGISCKHCGAAASAQAYAAYAGKYAYVRR